VAWGAEYSAAPTPVSCGAVYMIIPGGYITHEQIVCGNLLPIA